jgi:uncharacterized protein HemX
MFATLSQPIAEVPAEVVTKASEAIIESGGLLGALLILSVVINLVLGWVVIRVQNARVKDTDRIASTAKTMVETFAGVQNALANLHDAQKNQASAIQTLMNTILLQSVTRGVHPPTLGGG